MKVYNKYIVTLVLASSIVNVVLALFNQNDLVIFFIINVIVYLAITLLYAYLNPRARKALNTIVIVLFSGFLVIVSLKVVGIVTGR